MSARAHAPPCAAALLAHLNLLLMVVGAACVWLGSQILRDPLPSLPPPVDELVRLGALARLQAGAGGALVALGGAHWLLAHLALAAATAARPSAGLFIAHAALVAALCCGEAGWLAWSLVRLRSLPGDPGDALKFFNNLAIVFSLFLPGNRERLERASRADPLAVYLTLGGALALPLLQLAGVAAALCAARVCRRRRDTRPPRPATRLQGRDSFQYHRYGDADAPPQYQ